jgi:hypothetical protein
MPLRPDEREEVYDIVKEMISTIPKVNVMNVTKKEKPVDVAALVKSEVEKAIAKLTIPKDDAKSAVSETEKDSNKKGDIKK